MDRHELLVHLAECTWDYKNFGLVTLKIGEHSFILNYIGFGDMKGVPVLKLRPISHASEEMQAIAHALNGSRERMSITKA